MTIQSSTTEITASMKDVVHFLCDPRHLNFLLPQDKITDFQADETHCSFKAQGGIFIPLQFEFQDATTIRYKSGVGSPFPFTLTVQLSEQEENCTGYIVFAAELNGFMKMLVEKPLKGLFEQMSAQMKAYFQRN
ncbi:MAG: hypothetical protein ACKOXP_02815 [Flavobacteriales bacterium]